MSKDFDPQGRAALFSGQKAPQGAFRVECSSCSQHSRVGVAKLARLAFPVNLTNPFRYHHTWMRCPACGERSWVRIRPAR
jgi:hypothetical protein